jgi:hypothetical protein
LELQKAVFDREKEVEALAEEVLAIKCVYAATMQESAFPFSTFDSFS